MAEPTNQNVQADPTPEPEEVPQPTRLQNFVNKHPRAARITAITGAVTALVGAVHIAKTVQTRKQHLNAAGDHAKDALTELSATVIPSDTEV